MDAAPGDTRNANALFEFLAGLEAGTLGVLSMLAWMGLSSIWQRRSFWTPEDLMATAFHRYDPFGNGLGKETFQGMALYLLIYSLLGGLFALAVRGRVPRIRLLLVAVAFSLAWYYFSFHWLWKSVMPLVALLHVQQSTVLGHLIYGTILAQYPVYAARLAGREEIPVENAVVAEVQEPTREE